jgi:NADH dehydrogenase
MPIRAEPFRYRHLGQFHRHRPPRRRRRFRLAEAQRLSGLAALGRRHVYFLIGFRNRIAVILDWLWAYLTYQRGVRLITGAGSDS